MTFIFFALTEDLVNDVRERCGGVDYNAVFRNVFFRLMQSHNEFPFLWSFRPSQLGPVPRRSSIRRDKVSRSTSRTNTPSNRSMNLEKFLEPPQKNVTASSWLATKAFTFSTSQMWCSVRGRHPSVYQFPDRLDTPIHGHHEWHGSRAAAILCRPTFCRRRKRLQSDNFSCP